MATSLKPLVKASHTQKPPYSTFPLQLHVQASNSQNASTHFSTQATAARQGQPRTRASTHSTFPVSLHHLDGVSYTQGPLPILRFQSQYITSPGPHTRDPTYFSFSCHITAARQGQTGTRVSTRSTFQIASPCHKGLYSFYFFVQIRGKQYTKAYSVYIFRHLSPD